MVGLALIALDGLLPERAQSTSLYTGLALTLICVAAGLAGNAQVRWRGVSPAAGIVVGLVAGMLPLALRGSWSHAGSNMPQPIATTRAPAVASWQAPPDPRGNREAESSPTSKRLGPLLAEVAGLVQKARPALDDQHRVLVAVAQDRTAAADPDNVRGQLALSARELEDVESSLARIEYQNQDLRKDLNAVIGDMGPLTALNSSLHRMSDPADGNSGARGRVIQLATQTLVASQWIDGVDRRVAGARAVIRR